MRARIVGAVFAALAATSAMADWMSMEDDKAFGGKVQQALGFGDEAALGVRCEDGELQVTVATAENWKDELATMNLLKPAIVLSFDGAAVVTYPATLTESGVHKVIAVMEDDDGSTVRKVAEQIAATKKRVDVAVEFGGSRFYPSKVTAKGAKRHVERVLKACEKKDEAQNK